MATGPRQGEVGFLLSVEDLRRYAVAGHFSPGSMGPKVEAALRFIEQGGAEAIVTSSERLRAALAGRAGTHLRGTARRAAEARPTLVGGGVER